MTHEAFSLLMKQYLLDSLEPKERQAMDEHLASCPDCALELAILQDSLSLDEGGEVPASFSSAWRQAIRKEEADSMEKPIEKRSKAPAFRFRRWMAVAAAFVFVFGGALLTRSSLRPEQAAVSDTYREAAPAGSMSSYGGEMPAPDSNMMAVDAVRSAGAPSEEMAASPEMAPKIIRTVSIGMNTREFDKDLQQINDAIKAQGGYIEYSDVQASSGSRRSASITARIPKDRLDAFLSQVQTYGQLSRISESQEDVSESYRDVETRLKTQTAKIARLQELLARASTVSDILSIESEIANTQYQIDSLTGSLRGMDSKVSYSSVSIDLREQTAPSLPEKTGLGQRILDALSDSWEAFKALLEDVLVFLIIILPYLAALAVLLILIRLLIKRRKK